VILAIFGLVSKFLLAHTSLFPQPSEVTAKLLYPGHILHPSKVGWKKKYVGYTYVSKKEILFFHSQIFITLKNIENERNKNMFDADCGNAGSNCNPCSATLQNYWYSTIPKA